MRRTREKHQGIDRSPLSGPRGMLVHYWPRGKSTSHLTPDRFPTVTPPVSHEVLAGANKIST